MPLSLTGRGVPWLHVRHGAHGQLFVDRHQQFVHEARFRLENKNWPAPKGHDTAIRRQFFAPLHQPKKDRHVDCLVGCAEEKPRRPKGGGKNKSALAEFTAETRRWD